MPEMDPQQRLRIRVARNLNRLLKSRGLSKSELARSATISRNTLDMILNARRGATIDVLARLADALGIDVSEFFA